MKLNDFDFRIWSKLENGYIEYPALARLNSVLPAKYYENVPIPRVKFDERDDVKELELWTGFCDKNGDKIYEGDILYSFEDCSEDEAFKYKVVFKEGAFYLVECGDNGEEYDEDLISEFWLTELEIMGNIHENADLLEVKE